MFIGGLPKQVLQQIAELIDLPAQKEFFVCCSGSFRLEQLLEQAGVQAPIVSNDVSLVTCAIGTLAAHGRYQLENVPPGRYRAVLLAPIGLATPTDAIVVIEPGKKRVKFNFRAAKGGWISATLPPDAKELRYLDASGRVFWTRTKLQESASVKLPVGSYTVLLTREQGEPLEHDCTVEEGEVTALSFDDT